MEQLGLLSNCVSYHEDKLQIKHNLMLPFMEPFAKRIKNAVFKNFNLNWIELSICLYVDCYCEIFTLVWTQH